LLTLVVAHETSFNGADQDHLDTSKASDDAAIVNWWVNADPTPENLHTLTNCPVSGQQSQ
jgi:hypothetical protein